MLNKAHINKSNKTMKIIFSGMVNAENGFLIFYILLLLSFNFCQLYATTIKILNTINEVL